MTSLRYAELTHASSNPLKRWFQQRRLNDALRLAGAGRLLRAVDYGAGDGEFAARFMRSHPGAEVICFEPASALREQLAERIASLHGIRVVSRAEALPDGWAQVLFCLEVFEHLPEQETETALREIARVLGPDGALIVGVPVEIGPMALAKAVFRRFSRPGDADSRWPDVLAAALGRPSPTRPLVPLGDGLAYHGFHLGFDHRRLLSRLRERFSIERLVGSPFGLGPILMNTEIYVQARKTS